MSKLYGVCRVSTKKQNIDRQIRNIQEYYPNAIIVQDKFTGTKIEGREEFEKLLKIIKSDDTMVFDSVSRFSRNADEGCKLYERLFNDKVNLIFLQESYINTSIYRKTLDNQIKLQLNTGDNATDTFINAIIDALNKYTIELAKSQIRKAFEQAEKEVKDLQRNTKAGIVTAKLNGKRVGQPKGAKLITHKSIKSKELILKYSKSFNGSLDDKMCIKLTGICRNTYYTYKRELKLEQSKILLGD